MRGLGSVAAWVMMSLLSVGCAGPLLANDVPSPRPRATGAAQASRRPDPQPISLPADDGPHDRLTEWWYYTGHLGTADGRRFGFELVVFRAERGRFPVAWASHLAVTDEQGERFLYDQRSEVGEGVDRSTPASGFDLAIAGDLLPGIRGPAVPWVVAGSLGRHRLDAPGGRSTEGLPLGLSLVLDDGAREPLLHDGDGWVDFGPAGGSYYYSRPRMSVTGTLSLDGETVPVTGTAWFDHQWGDFISVGGGWDWFAVNLDDGTDLTISVVRDPAGSVELIYGTVSDAKGDRHLPSEAVSVEALGEWTSPATGATWPAGWRIAIPEEGLDILLAPTLAEQELDTRDTTGVIYWEGSQEVSATRDGVPVGGEAYVELTGYASGQDP